MTLPPEPDDIDFFVGGVEPEPGADEETARYIKELKSRPEHRAEVEEARKILDAFYARNPDHKIPNPKLLLAHWHRTVADLLEAQVEAEKNGTNGVQQNEVVRQIEGEPKS